MPREVKRRRVDWERASCLGIETDLFYMMRTDLQIEGLTYNHLRRMCFDCPIQRECLEVGTALERYGFWGGLSEEERNAIYEKRDGKVIARLKRDLLLMQMPYQPLANIVLSVERQFGDEYQEGRRNEREAKSRATNPTTDGNLL